MDEGFILIDDENIEINKVKKNELLIKDYILKDTKKNTKKDTIKLDTIKLDNDETNISNNSQNLVYRKNNIKDKPSYEIKPLKTASNNIFWNKILNTLSDICLCCH